MEAFTSPVSSTAEKAHIMTSTEFPEASDSNESPGMAIVDAHGAESSAQMLTLFESYLEKQAVEDEEVYDRVRQGAVVFMGTLARHMESDTPKVKLLYNARPSIPINLVLPKEWALGPP